MAAQVAAGAETFMAADVFFRTGFYVACGEREG
jgi:hypothetical protein